MPEAIGTSLEMIRTASDVFVYDIMDRPGSWMRQIVLQRASWHELGIATYCLDVYLRW